MLKNILFSMSILIFIGCSGSDILKDLIGFKDTKGSLDTSNMDTTFKVKLEVNEVITNITNPLPTDITRASYYIEDEMGTELFEYKAVLKTTIDTTCASTLVESDGITYNCTTSYSNPTAYPGYDRNKTIKLFNSKTYTVKMEEVRGLSDNKIKTIGTLKLK